MAVLKEKWYHKIYSDVPHDRVTLIPQQTGEVFLSPLHIDALSFVLSSSDS